MFGKPEFDILAFGAHPDDVEICCGGTVAKLTRQGYRAAVVTLTSAELGTRGDSQTRAREFAEAARILGVEHHQMLDIPDGQVNPAQENRLKVVEVIRQLRPRVVFAHHAVARHPDHRNGHTLIRDAVFLAGLSRVETASLPWRPYKIVYYAERYEVAPSFIVDISETYEQKMNAIRAYHSQFYSAEMEKYGTQQTTISQPGFLDHIVLRAHQYGIYIGVRYAEPFVVLEPLAIADPVALFDEKNWYTIP